MTDPDTPREVSRIGMDARYIPARPGLRAAAWAARAETRCTHLHTGRALCPRAVEEIILTEAMLVAGWPADQGRASAAGSLLGELLACIAAQGRELTANERDTGRLLRSLARTDPSYEPMAIRSAEDLAVLAEPPIPVPDLGGDQRAHLPGGPGVAAAASAAWAGMPPEPPYASYEETRAWNQEANLLRSINREPTAEEAPGLWSAVAALIQRQHRKSSGAEIRLLELLWYAGHPEQAASMACWRAMVRRPVTVSPEVKIAPMQPPAPPLPEATSEGMTAGDLEPAPPVCTDCRAPGIAPDPDSRLCRFCGDLAELKRAEDRRDLDSGAALMAARLDCRRRMRRLAVILVAYLTAVITAVAIPYGTTPSAVMLVCATVLMSCATAEERRR